MKYEEIEQICCGYSVSENVIFEFENNNNSRQDLIKYIDKIISSNKEYSLNEIVDFLLRLSYGDTLILRNIDTIVAFSNSFCLKKLLSFESIKESTITAIQQCIDDLLNNMYFLDLASLLDILSGVQLNDETNTKIRKYIVNNLDKIIDSTLERVDLQNEDKYYNLSAIQTIIEFLSTSEINRVLTAKKDRIYELSYDFDKLKIFLLCEKYQVPMDKKFDEVIRDCFTTTDLEIINKFKQLLVNLIADEKCTIDDIEVIGKGATTTAIKVGNQVLKVGKNIKQYENGNKQNEISHKLFLESSYRDIVCTNDGCSYLFEIQPYVDSKWYLNKSEDEIFDITYSIYAHLRSDKIAWNDPAERNIGVIIKDEKKRYVIFDKDYIYSVYDKNKIRPNAFLRKYEKKYENELIRNIISKFFQLSSIADKEKIDNLVRRLIELDIDNAIDRILVLLNSLLNRKVLSIEQILANADSIIALNPEKYKSTNDLVRRLEWIKSMNMQYSRIPLRENLKGGSSRQ